jgi:DNA-binding YbaB/EbfC family protein
MVGGNMGDIMKQAQKMQEQLQKQQEELASAEVTGESGAGMVRVTMTGRHDVKKVELDDGVLTEDKEFLEDLLAAAVNDAVRKIEEKNKNSMSGLASSMGMPPGFKMPF